jgi:glycine cleavage system H protein
MGAKREMKGGPAGGETPLPSSYRGWAVLPCNGLDKEAGALAREMALAVVAKGARLICPVRYNRSPDHYRKEVEGSYLLVIDGCKKECADKLAREHGLGISRKLNVKELLRELGLKSGKSPMPDPTNLRALLSMLEQSGTAAERDTAIPAQEADLAGSKGTGPGRPCGLFEEIVELREFAADKFIFKVPAAGYFFNENDCWARVEGGRARIGVSDYVQQSASDMVFFEPPAMGTELEQFDDAGSLESTKTALDIISPVSGKVVAVNGELVDSPELINEDPYVRGWAVEVELGDFESDRELLMDSGGYFDYLRGKVERELEEKNGT